MSSIIDTAVGALETKLSGTFDGSARFVIGDEGAVVIDSGGVRSGGDADGADADVTLTADADTFRAILDGDLDPAAAFMSGRLSVDGDMSVAMRLGGMLVRA